jgi:hypothetical protein
VALPKLVELAQHQCLRLVLRLALYHGDTIETALEPERSFQSTDAERDAQHRDQMLRELQTGAVRLVNAQQQALVDGHGVLATRADTCTEPLRDLVHHE